MRFSRRAFTLLELLLVIAILSLLAALLLPALGRVKVRSLTLRARQEMTSISTAVHEYEEAYGRLPVSQRVEGTASSLGEDYTYGSTFTKKDGSKVIIGGPGAYLNNNNEVMAILLDLEFYPDGKPTPNRGHVENPQRRSFLNPHPASGTNAPGFGPDGAYRDPWGISYMITLDLNHDGAARDFFYRDPTVSQDPQYPDRGLNGLVKKANGKGESIYEANAPIMIWSPGPDKMINPNQRADEGANKDNLLNWQ